MSQSVVSYALFSHPAGGSWKSGAAPGDISTYARFLPTIIRAHHALWPGWEMRLHFDEVSTGHRYFPSLRRMADRGLLRLMPCGRASAVGMGPMWRFLPVFDGDDRVVVSLDIDSLPILNMRMCVEEFLNSQRTMLVVHACETHNTVMAGMLAVQSRKFRAAVGAETFEGFLHAGGERYWNYYGADEAFLRDVVWPRTQSDAMLIRLGTDKPSLIHCEDTRSRWSAAIPEDIRAGVCEMGNAFSPYIGASGYDVQRALDYYSSVDLPSIRAIAECEDVSPAEVSFP